MDPDQGTVGRATSVALVLAAVFFVATSARLDLNIPGSPVPQSAQTLAVLLVGVGLGGRLAALALLAYLAVGALGAPVFADGSAGWQHLIGPTAGYLVGFIAAAVLVGTLQERGTLRRFMPAFGAMLAAHAIILALGWGRLAGSTGFVEAYHLGVQPFVVGGIAKSVVVAFAAILFSRWKRLSPLAMER